MCVLVWPQVLLIKMGYCKVRPPSVPKPWEIGTDLGEGTGRVLAQALMDFCAGQQA